MPYSEFLNHKVWWQHFRWGMNDDLLALLVRLQANLKKFESYEVKEMTTFAGSAYRHLARVHKLKPVSVIRSGFMSIVNAIKGMKK